MTFRKFQQIAAAHRPDAVVHEHGKFGGVPDVAVYFVKDGRKSKVYSYRGTYAEILGRLGVKVVTENDVAALRGQIETCKRMHGRQSLFTRKIMDYSDEIAELTAKLESWFTDEYVRDWE